MTIKEERLKPLSVNMLNKLSDAFYSATKILKRVRVAQVMKTKKKVNVFMKSRSTDSH